MHTQVSLSSIGQLVDGTLENPSSVLGAPPRGLSWTIGDRGAKLSARGPGGLDH